MSGVQTADNNLLTKRVFFDQPEDHPACGGCIRGGNKETERIFIYPTGGDGGGGGGGSGVVEL